MSRVQVSTGNQNGTRAAEVTAMRAVNRRRGIRHGATGLALGQVRDLPTFIIFMPTLFSSCFQYFCARMLLDTVFFPMVILLFWRNVGGELEANVV